MKYDEYAENKLMRIYSRDRIEDKLGVVPDDAEMLSLPSFIEKIFGEFYLVSQMDRHKIEDREASCAILYMGDECDKNLKTIRYFNSFKAFTHH